MWSERSGSSLESFVGRLPNCRRYVKDNVDLLDKEGTLVGFDAQARQHAVAADCDDFVSELRVLSFDLVEELRGEMNEFSFKNKFEFELTYRIIEDLPNPGVYVVILLVSDENVNTFDITCA